MILRGGSEERRSNQGARNQKNLHARRGAEYLSAQHRVGNAGNGEQRSACPGISTGYGRHGQLHEQHFFELAGEQPVLVEFIVTDAQADRLLGLVRDNGLAVFYARIATEFGSIGPDGDAGDGTVAA